MNFFILWSIIGLIDFAVTHDTHQKKHHVRVLHGGRHHLSTEEDSTSTLLITPTPAVNGNQPLSNYDGFNLIFNFDEKMIGFTNCSENVGVASIDREGGPVKIFVDSKTGVILYYQHVDDVKLIKNKDFTGDIMDVFNIILTNYKSKDLNLPGDTSKIKSSSEEGLTVVSEVYLHLGHPKEKGDTRYRSLEFQEAFFNKLKRLYAGPLRGLLQGRSPFPLRENLNRFLTISIGLKKMFTRADGGLKLILRSGVKFEVNSLFNAKNGAEVFIYILRQTGAKLNLATLWRNLLNNIEEDLEIIQLLGGGESKNGVDETFGVVGHIWSALNLRLSLPNLIKYLTEASSEENWTKENEGDFSQALKDIKNITDEQSQKYDNSKVILPFVSFFTNLTTNSLIHNSVNISDLVEKYRKRDIVGGLKFVADTLSKWTSPERFSTFLFDAFTAFLNSSSDPNALKRLVPGISIDQFTSNNSLLNSICNSHNLDTMLKNSSNSNEILKGVPVFSEFNKVCNNSFGQPFDFTKTLNGATIPEYISKNLVVSPFKWTSDTFSKFVHDSGSFVKHVVFDPINILNLGVNKSPILGMPTSSPLFNTIPDKADCKEGDNCEEKKITTVAGKTCADDEDCESKVIKKECGIDCDDEKSTVTPSKPCEDCDDKKDKEPTSEKPCEFDCDDKKVVTEKVITEKVVTEKVVTEKVIIKTSTDKDCKEDCEEQNTKPTERPTKDCGDNCDKHESEPTTESGATTVLEFKHHRQNKLLARHQGHRNHHESHHERNNQHHTRSYHDSRKHHHDRNHHEKKHHSRMHHNSGEKHLEKKEERHHHKREERHHKREEKFHHKLNRKLEKEHQN